MQNEDVPYISSDIAITDADVSSEVVENKTALQEAIRYLDAAIATHNSFDAIDLSPSTKLTALQQVAVNKAVVDHLRSIRENINNKLQEGK